MLYPVEIKVERKINSIVIKNHTWEPLPIDIEAMCYDVWGKEVIKNPQLRPGKVLAANSMSIDQHSVRISAGESLYPHVMGTTSNPSIISAKYHRKFIGVMAVTISADNDLIFGIRSSKIDWPRLCHAVPAGRLKPSEKTPEDGIIGEFNTELGMLVNRGEGEWIGVLADLTLGRMNFECVKLVRSPLSTKEIREKAQKAMSGHEHKKLIAVPWKSELIVIALANPNEWVPTGWAGITLAARRAFGTNEFPNWTPTPRTYDEHMALARAATAP